MLVLDHVTKSFYHRAVFRDISISFPPGKITAIMGRNGAGKSTLLRIIAGLTSFDQGQIRINDIILSGNNPASRQDCFYLGHAPGLYPPLSAVENVAIAARFYGRKLTPDEIHGILDEVGLFRQHNDPINVFSQGMMQRLKLALAIAVPWKALLFDEPFTGLDEEGRTLTQHFLKTWIQPYNTILAVVHDYHWALAHCDNLMVFHQKKIEYFGPSIEADPDQVSTWLSGT
ncbi:MAG: ATP-binding cassette domain-containing protein [Fidelibacterota bacterium]